jgi:hypothetical protein
MKSKTERIADEAKMIVDGIAFKVVGDYIYAINLKNIHYRAKISKDMKIISTNMSDSAIKHTKEVLRLNIDFMI